MIFNYILTVINIAIGMLNISTGRYEMAFLNGSLIVMCMSFYVVHAVKEALRAERLLADRYH